MTATQPRNAPAQQKSLLRRYWWVVGIAVAAIVVFFAVPYASADPDGLEKVAEDKEFIQEAEDNGYEWLPDYTVPGVDNENLSGILAGLIGLVIVFVIMAGFGWLVARKRAPA
jgi:hypothetical protein